MAMDMSNLLQKSSFVCFATCLCDSEAWVAKTVTGSGGDSCTRLNGMQKFVELEVTLV